MGNKTPNLNLPLIDVTNSEDLQLKFIEFVASICGVDNASALSILDSIVSSNTEKIKNLKSTKQDLLIPGENITIVNNVISGVGGVKEEDVMDIIENNAEQTDTLEVEDATEIPIGTSETFDATSDEQIPTSKAVSDLMAGAGGKLYRHKITTTWNSINDYYSLICGYSEPFTAETLKQYLIEKGAIDYNNGIPIDILYENDNNPTINMRIAYHLDALKFRCNLISGNSESVGMQSTTGFFRISSDTVIEL